MPLKGNNELPLPETFEVATDFDGKVFYINHVTKETSWIDPRDAYTKPKTFADCEGDELPYGWEEMYDPRLGIYYYTNHATKVNQLEDPRLQWRAKQQDMLKEYLSTAHEDLETKRDIYSVKQQRLELAKDEYQHLNETLVHSGWKTTSSSSLNSTSSVGSTKYDPDLLKADVHLAKKRIARLRGELQQIRTEMSYKERGVETLTQIDSKMAGQPGGYNLQEAQAIMQEIRNIQQSLSSGEREKQNLIQSLAKLKDDMPLRLVTEGSSPDLSLLSIPHEIISTESQTDLTGEYNTGARLAEMARMRLQYDEARKRITTIQRNLSSVEDHMVPGQTESDKDRLLLIQEKEQLLRELRSIVRTKGRSEAEIVETNEQIRQLQKELAEAMEISNRQIAERIKLQDERTLCIEQLIEATKETARLESKLRSLSQSTLSSGSSRGSLGSLGSLSASSKGSLNSLSLTDIYGTSQYPNNENNNLHDLHSWVNQIMKGHNSISTIPEAVSPTVSLNNSFQNLAITDINIDGATGSIPESPEAVQQTTPTSLPISSQQYDIGIGAPPSYEQHLQQVIAGHPQGAPPIHEQSPNVYKNPPQTNTNYSPTSKQRIPHLPLDSSATPILENINNRQHAVVTETGEPPLSPISESSSGVCNNLSGVNTRSVSAAVSDESVAGDSGVFEASVKRMDEDGLPEKDLESAQIQIKLKYEGVEGQLHIGVEQARNLAALAIPERSLVMIKTSLLPSPLSQALCTKPSSNLNSPKWNELFKLQILENKLCSKTLQVNIWCRNHLNQEEHLGCVQVSLADFDPKTVSIKWYNVLSFKFMQADVTPSRKTKLPKIPSPDVPENVSVTQEDEKKVKKLLEGTSARLRKSSIKERPLSKERHRSSSLDSGAIRGTHAAVLSMREESSDESTIISSQTSTLTRNQGPEDMIKHGNQNGPEEISSESQEEDVDDETPGLSTDDFIQSDTTERGTDYDELEAQHGSPSDTLVKTATCEAGVNTEGEYKGLRSVKDMVKSKEQENSDYICKLNRSDSDSSVPTFRRGGSFQRNSFERRSLRWKKSPSPHNKHQQPTVVERGPNMKTSMDLELDLQASQTKLAYLHEEIAKLKEVKRVIEEAQHGDQELPAWFTDSDEWQKLLADARRMFNKDSGNLSREERKAEALLRKVTKEVYKLRKHQKREPDVMSFREKMAFFTTVNMSIPVIPSELSSDSEEEVKMATIKRVKKPKQKSADKTGDPDTSPKSPNSSSLKDSKKI
ncbi:unnamed protein product [Owenia fusiformis]|uniref:Protein kibra n=1 Tax=Owenia fusiformis TaxID=6347 RepID=A0A8J1TJF0_OWEFU|nr:unnamed protein product [Owenia fusiformis]